MVAYEFLRHRDAYDQVGLIMYLVDINDINDLLL